jgi:hypothetical protein
MTVSALLAACFFAFSMANLRDFFALNREIASVVDDFQAQGIPPDRFDAGWAWVGWFHPLPLTDELPERPNSGATEYLLKTFPLVMDDYVVTLTPEPDRPVLQRRSYMTWLPPPGGPRDLWVLGPKARRTRQATAKGGRP